MEDKTPHRPLELALLPSQERILAAANRLHQHHAAAQIRIADVAKAANVSPALVILHFKSKDELLFAAYLRWLDEVFTPALVDWKAVNPVCTPLDFLVALRELSGDSVHRMRDVLTSSYWWTEPEVNEFAARLSTHRAIMLSCLQSNYPGADQNTLEQADIILQAIFDQTVRASAPKSFCIQSFRELLETRSKPIFEWLEFKAKSAGALT